MNKVFFSIIAILLTCLFLLSNYLEKERTDIYVEDLLYLPSGKFLKGAAMGFDNMLSDLLWIKAVAYFGGHARTDQDYSWMAHMLDIVTTLDPYYQYPYEFGGVVLATEIGDVEKSTSLLEKGMKNVQKSHPRYWYLPFFIAFNYMFHKNDYKTAAKYLEQASKFPQSPDYIPLLVSRLYADADSPEIAVTFLKEMIQSTDKPELKTKLVQRLNEVINANNIRLLNRAVDRFFTTWGRYPQSLEEMAKKGIIHFVPADPRGGQYFLSKEDHSVQNTKKSEELKVHIKKKKQPIINMVPAEQ